MTNHYSYSYKTILLIVLLAISTTPYAQDLQYSTYYGGNNEEAGYAIAVAKNGDFCLLGITKGSTTNIATPGSFRETLPSSTKSIRSFLAYFDSSGKRKWGTYIKASLTDIAIDSTGNIYCTGTNADTSIITAGAYQTFERSVTDAVLFKFSKEGSLIWGTYYGGYDLDIGNKIAITPDNGVLLAGRTESAYDIATPYCHQPQYSGLGDAFIVKFDSNGVRKWATYYGGSQRENQYTYPDIYSGVNITCDHLGNIYLSGRTQSNNNIATKGTFKPELIHIGSYAPRYIYTHSGTSEAFLVKFNKKGQREWGTYFGDSGSEFASGLTCDYDGNIYISGYTDSRNGIATNGSFKSNNTSRSLFIAKFNPAGGLEWGTYYGDSVTWPYYSGCRIMFDGYKYLYVTGSSGDSMSTPNSPQPMFRHDDIAVAKFDTKGNRIWGTYFGGADTDRPLGLTVRNNDIYVTGMTLSDSSISTPNGHQTSYGGAPSRPPIPSFLVGDAFIVRYKERDTMVTIGSNFEDSILCMSEYKLTIPYKVNKHFSVGNTFTIQLSDSNGNFVNAINIGSKISSVNDTIQCNIPTTITPNSNYKIRVIASNPSDTSVERNLNIHDVQLPSLSIYPLPGDTVCSNDVATFVATISHPGISYKYNWRVNGTTMSNDTGSVFYSYALKSSDIISCTITSDVHCLSTSHIDHDSASVYIDTPKRPVVSISILPNDTLCTNDTATLFISSTFKPGIYPQYLWHRDNRPYIYHTDTISDTSTLNHTTYFVKLITNAYCRSEDTVSSDTLSVYRKAKIPISVIPIIQKHGVSGPRGLGILFTPTITNNGDSTVYQWMHNGQKIAGATSDSLYLPYSSLSNGDSVALWVENHSQYCHTADTLIHGIIIKDLNVKSISQYQRSLYPNPNKGSFILKGSIGSSDAVTVSVSNTLGQEVYRKEVITTQKKLDIKIDLPSNVPDGLYIIKVSSDQFNYSQPFTLSR